MDLLREKIINRFTQKEKNYLISHIIVKQSQGTLSTFTFNTSCCYSSSSPGSGGDGGGLSDLQASNVTPRTALLSWKPPSNPVGSYRFTYQTEGQEMKVRRAFDSVCYSVF